MAWTEVLGFVTGALSVWLYARERVAAWPVGIANSAFWLVLFWDAGLYLDSGLQVVYIVLGLVGWYWWSFGGERRTALPVVRTRRTEVAILAALAVVASAAMWWVDARIADSALPFWDAWTTVLSLVAQYMLTRKLFGSWWCWIAVDIGYLGMYVHEHLYLTAALQPVFLVLCLKGLRDWRRSLSMGTATGDVGMASA